MDRWIRYGAAVVLLAALVALMALLPSAPAWTVALLATTTVMGVARAFGWVGGIVAVVAVPTLIARPWTETDPLATVLTVEPFLLGVFGVAALGGSWIGRLERTLGTQRTVSRQAAFDPLTGVLNRTAFEASARDAIQTLEERKGIVALLFIDLDRFKVVNDTYGHEIGDILLMRVAEVLRSHVRENDLVGRLGGDEFTVMLRGLRERDSAEAIARKLLELLNAPHEIAGRHIEVGASIGIAICPEDGRDVPSLLKNADYAMYQVKESGRNDVGFTSAESRVGHDRRLEVERQMKAALAEDEFELHYQPKVDLVSGAAVGVEMLLRWNNPKLGLVSPDEFVPMAEETGMILPLGRWLLRQACFQLRDWDDEGLPRITLAVNVSTLQFRQPDFVGAVEEALQASGIDPDRLELEITESVLMRDYLASLRTLTRLKRLGVRIAMDDFGTGYSSLAYLQNLPIRTLKIDRSFVSGLDVRGLDGAHGTGPIVETILTLGTKLRLEVVAEGIETREQMHWLRDAGCPYGQGYLFCKPYKADRIAKLLARSGKPAPTDYDPRDDRLLLTGA